MIFNLYDIHNVYILEKTISRSVVPVLGLVEELNTKEYHEDFFSVLCEGNFMHLLKLTVLYIKRRRSEFCRKKSS